MYVYFYNRNMYHVGRQCNDTESRDLKVSDFFNHEDYLEKKNNKPTFQGENYKITMWLKKV